MGVVAAVAAVLGAVAIERMHVDRGKGGGGGVLIKSIFYSLV